jgi:pimeloyl-ACP methyl ester carboxylesterase
VTTARPFTVDIPQARLDAIRERVAAFRWDAFPDAGGWSAGAGVADVRRLCDHWLNGYDWRAQEARINRLPQFVATADGQSLHFVHIRSGGGGSGGDSGGARAPILLLHGWPGSFLEFEEVIAPLVADGHDVIVPSLPGYAFSGRPDHPIGPRRVGAILHALMTGTLGYDRYLVQGGDWGSAIGAWMAHDRPQAVAGLHLNMVLIQAKDASPSSPEERAWAARRAELAQEEAAYAQLQGTRPQSLAYAMIDSPVGVLAWITEKFGAWSDLPRTDGGAPDLFAGWSEDWLLTNAMLYLATDAFPTSTWLYKGRIAEGSGTFPAGARVRVPTGVAAFPDPVFPPPPRSQAEKTYDIVRWTDMAEGGHFAAAERPDAWLADVRAFVAGLG